MTTSALSGFIVAWVLRHESAPNKARAQVEKLAKDFRERTLIDMGYINYHPELDGRREYHQHGEHQYIIGANGKCWFCGQTVEKEPNPAQLTIESHPQLQMEVRS